jgi:hypothetical protein
MLATREYDALIDLEDLDLDLELGERPAGVTARRIMAWSALTAAVLAGGLYAGFELRRRRLGRLSSRPLNPYRAYEDDQVSDTDTGTEYGAVGI